ncbi:MAG: NusA-like transcription termination signal-binding factor [Candidatus Hodarchaeales archaeon]|jgi:N utilization substance protein A
MFGILKRSGFTIRLSQDELSFLSLLEDLTGTLASDCVWDKDTNRVIFVVHRKDAGRIIGCDGITIRRLSDHLHKQIDIIEYSERPKEFVANTLAPAKITNVEIHEKSGKKTAVVTVNPKERGKAIGKNGRNIQRSRILMKRHFRVNNVIIQSRS